MDDNAGSCHGQLIRIVEVMILVTMMCLVDSRGVISLNLLPVFFFSHQIS